MKAARMSYMIGWIALVVAVVCLPDVVDAQTVVNFPDPGLEAAIRDEISKPTGDIYDTDLDGVFLLYADGRGIEDLTGLEYCVNLMILGLDDNLISNLGPLAGLDLLMVLSVAENNVSDLTPLASLPGLTDLEVSNNPLSDLSPLATIPTLERLYAENNQISDLSPLAGLPTLFELVLMSNNISNLAPLAGISTLGFLALSDNQISDLGPLAGLTQLQELWLAFNQIQNVAPLAGMADLWTLDLSANRVHNLGPLAGLNSIEELRLTFNQIGDISPLAGLTTLQFLELDMNVITDFQPLAGLTDLDNLYLSNNQADVIGALVTNTGLEAGDVVDISHNWLDVTPGSQAMTDIQTMLDRGVNLTWDSQDPPAKPATPIGLTAAVNGANDVVLTWIDMAIAEQGYTLQRRMQYTDGSWQEWTTLRWLPAGTQTFTDDTLTEDGAYKYRVRAHNAVGPSNFTAPVTVWRGLAAPAAPSNLTAVHVAGSNDVQLNWDDNSDNEQEFTIQRRHRQADMTWTDYVTLGHVGPDSTTYLDTNIPQGAWYKYQVRARNPLGPSNWAAPVLVECETSPKPPEKVTARLVNTDADARVQWEDHSAVEEGFAVERRQETAPGVWSDWTELRQTAANVTVFVDTSLPGDGTYQYRVRSFNALGFSDWPPAAQVVVVRNGGTSLAGVNAMQVNDQCVNVVYSLTATADVMVEVRNIAGRMVRTIPCGTASAGINTATWNLRNSAGAPVPAGTYLCTVTARNEDGTQASAVRTVSVRR